MDKTRIILSYLLTRHTLLLYATATVFLIAGALTGGTDAQAEGATGGFHALQGLLVPVGLGIIISTLVASVLNFAFQSAIHNAFSIVQGAEGAEILRIYANRKAALEEIADRAERVNRVIDVLAVSGTSLFHSQCPLLEEIGRRFIDNTSTEVRILLLDPRSRFAVERSLREEGQTIPPTASFDYPSNTLCRDTLQALMQLEKVAAQNASRKQFSCNVRLYNAAPMLMYVHLDDNIFVEQYHYGIPRDQVALPYTLCLGKAVPVFEASARSDIGHILASHFDYLWDRSEGRELKKGCANQIQESLKSPDWFDRYLETDQDDEERLAPAVTIVPGDAQDALGGDEESVDPPPTSRPSHST